MGRRPKNFQGPTDEEIRQSELNNFDRDEMSEDFSDSPFADRLPDTEDEDENYDENYD